MMKSKPPTKKQTGLLKYVVLFICCLIILGIYISATMMPESLGGGPSTNSLFARHRRPLTEKVREWLPATHVVHSAAPKPPWEKKFWTPIDVEMGGSDPMVTLCKLDFKGYWESPHSYPMFRDLVELSACRGSNRRRENLSTLMKEIKDNDGKASGAIVPPTGFVFHESRVGSTLVANTLACDEWALVFSESGPMSNAIMMCHGCTRKQHIKVIRDVATLMGRSPFHKHLFFKFQSITVTNMEVVLEAFPDTPWAFVYRSPVQTMMSHLDPKKGGGNAAPCMRSKRSPSDEVLGWVEKTVPASETAPNAAWCAAHLNMLCVSALRAYESHGLTIDRITGEKVQHGLLINYESLPGIVATGLLPLFGVYPSDEWVAKMKIESQQYSKSRTPHQTFEGDSKDKEERATESIVLYADKILQPTYKRMNSLSVEIMKGVFPELYSKIASTSNVGEEDAVEVNWKALHDVPDEVLEPMGGAMRSLGPPISNVNFEAASDPRLNPHSHAALTKHYVPWSPFSNTHTSRPFDNVECPPTPPVGYPKTYSIVEMTDNWNTDNTEIPPFHYDSLCHFDFQNETQLQSAYAYQAAEVPFIVYNSPEVDAVVKKWDNLDYLSAKLGTGSYRTEIAKTNHFMYWKNAGQKFLRSAEGKIWKPPTKVVSETFEEWLETAVKSQNKSIDERDYQYFRVSSDMGNSWLFDELPFFQPKKSLFLVQPKAQAGIHCRFGMRSVIAEAHFDGSRNTVVQMGGLRRWILAHPNQCRNMHMLTNEHPSGRHSAVDWSAPDHEKFPNFKNVQANEVILQPGDIAYIPTYWIHYITSININYQCNSRSGASRGFDADIKQCGF